MNISDFQIIHTYARCQAIDDGVLVDVTQIAKEAGIKFPVAITTTLYHDFIEPSSDIVDLGQSTEGRLWDVLSMFRFAARGHSGPHLSFKVIFITGTTSSGCIVRRLVALKATCHPGDDMEPVITIMLPDED
jgi:hypothetical protein